MKIKLTQGKYTTVNASDFRWLNQYKWYLNSAGYAVRKLNKKTILMHRVINQTPEGFHTDHINGVSLDNRRKNLRTATNSQNSINTTLRIDNTSGYKGVIERKDQYRKKRWLAQINYKGEHINIGFFLTKEEAATAYDLKAKELFGGFAKLNFQRII